MIENEIIMSLQVVFEWLKCLSFIWFHNVEFGNVSSQICTNFSSLSLNFYPSFSSFGSTNTNISGYFEFEFAENPNHQTWVYSSLSIKG